MGASTETPTVRARFVNGALWSVAGATICRGLTLVAMVVVGRMLGSTAFGELGMIQSTLGVFGIFAGTGLGLMATKYVAECRGKDQEATGEYVSLTLKIASLTGLLASIMLFLLAPRIASELFHRAALVTEIRIASALVLFLAINGVQTGVLAGLENFRISAAVTIVRAVFVIIATLLGASWGGLLGVLIGLTVAESLASCVGQYGVAAACRKIKVRVLYVGLEWGKLKTLWRFALPATLMSLVIQPAMWTSNLFLINTPDGFSALGVFNAADKYRQLILFLPASLTPVVLSLLSNLHGSTDLTAFRKVFMANLWINVVIVAIPILIFMSFAPTAMSAFGPDFQAGSSTLIILAASSLVVVLNTSLGQVLISTDRIWWRLGMDLVLGCTLVFCSWLWVPTLQANGLAFANLAAFGFTTFMLALAVGRVLKKSRLSVELLARSFPQGQ